MKLVRLTVPLGGLDDLDGLLARTHGPAVLACPDANAVMVAATRRGRPHAPAGVWLEVSSSFPAAMAARDVATLAWLVHVEHVVIDAGTLAEAHADVVRALLTEDEVNLENEAGTLRHAFNRPSPPRPISVWSFDGTALRCGETRLTESSRTDLGSGESTTFA
jgi:hypothetical protein